MLGLCCIFGSVNMAERPEDCHSHKLSVRYAYTQLSEQIVAYYFSGICLLFIFAKQIFKSVHGSSFFKHPESCLSYFDK